LVLNGNVIERRAVQVGNDLGDEVLIIAGLGAGESVVIDGPSDLEDGDRVQEMEQ